MTIDPVPAATQDMIEDRYLLETFLATTPDHVYFKDLEGRFTRISASLARWFELAGAGDAVGRTDADFFAPDHASAARADELRVMRTGEDLVAHEECEKWPDGRETWVSTTKVPLRDQTGRVVGIFGLSRDITLRRLAQERLEEQGRELERLAAQLERMTLYDQLTDIHNRRGFDLLGSSAVASACRDRTPLCVLFLDLDNLKEINDGFGHATGDRALVEAAAILRQTVRVTDVVGRVGGDEFAAVLTGLAVVDRADIFRRLRTIAHDRAKRAGLPDPLTFSIGVAVLQPGEPRTLEELVAEADRAMYAEKRAGEKPGLRLLPDAS
jgi:diguanylate cyclase (GGDEF)-like protein/PAS domain S-box-containing protein